MADIMSELYPTGSDTSVLDYDTNPSVLKYQYDINGSQYYDTKQDPPQASTVAQAVKDDYFDFDEHSHNLTITYDVKTYTWNYTVVTGNNQDLELYMDLSNKVVGVSYNCNSDSDIRTSASLSMIVPMDDDFWYMNKIYDIKESRQGGSTGNSNSMWIPQVYCIKEIIVDNETGNETERYFGFFLPDNSSYSYDATSNTFTLQLQNLAYGLTAEGGGTLVTAMRSYDYYFDVAYNHNPTKITAYRSQTALPSTVSTTETASTDAEHTQDKTNLLRYENNALSNIPDNAIKFGTAEVLFPTELQRKIRTINTPLPISISGYENGRLLQWSGVTMTRLIDTIAMGHMDSIMNNYCLPITNWQSPSQDSELTAKSDIFPLGWDFQNGTDTMSIAKTILSDRYYDPMIWIDEDRQLCVDTLPTFPNTWRSVIYYTDYADLIIGEELSINEKEFYTAVEVYGKNNEYYGMCDATINGFKSVINPNGNAEWRSSYFMDTSFIPKTKVVNDDSIESDLDCYNRAEYEVWKSFNNNVTINVKVRDNDIWKFERISHVVGQQLFEYRLLQGKGKTIRCLLTKASLDNGVWSLELKPFYSFASSYDWYDMSVYYQFKTKFYDQFLGAKWNTKEIAWYRDHSGTEHYVTEKEKHTLSQPVILAWRLINNETLRLYISGIDIGLSVVKVFTNEHNGAVNSSNFVGEAVNTDGTGDLPWGTPHAESVEDIEDGQHIYKVFDYNIEQSGSYSFNCQLYNIYYESSVGSESVLIDVALNNNKYLTDEHWHILTTENGNKLKV